MLCHTGTIASAKASGSSGGSGSSTTQISFVPASHRSRTADITRSTASTALRFPPESRESRTGPVTPALTITRSPSRLESRRTASITTGPRPEFAKSDTGGTGSSPSGSGGKPPVHSRGKPIASASQRVPNSATATSTFRERARSRIALLNFVVSRKNSSGCNPCSSPATAETRGARRGRCTVPPIAAVWRTCAGDPGCKLHPYERGDRLTLRPRPEEREDLVGGLLLRPLRVEVVPTPAALQTRLALGVAQALRLLEVGPAGFQVVGNLVDVSRHPFGNKVAQHVLDNALGVGFERVAVARAAGGEAEGHDVARLVGADGATHELDLPLPPDGAFCDDPGEVQVYRAGVVTEFLHKTRSANADAGTGRRGVAAEEWLRGLELGVIGDAHEQDHRGLVGDPHLHRAGAAAVLTRAGAVLPMLGERDQERELVLHQLHVGGAAEGAPGEAEGVHALHRRTPAHAFGVDLVGDHVRERQPPLRLPGDDVRVPGVGGRGRDAVPLGAREHHLREHVRARAHHTRGDHDRARRRRPVVGVEDSAFGYLEGERLEGGAAYGEVVEDVGVDVVRDVPDHGLDVGVIRGEVLRGGAGEVEGDLIPALDERQVSIPDEPVRFARRVREGRAAVRPVEPRRDLLPCAFLGDLEHPAHQARHEVLALALAQLDDAGANPVGRRRAGFGVRDDHLRSADAESGEHLLPVVSDLVVLADLGGRKIHPFEEARGRGDGHPSRFACPRFGGVVRGPGPADQLSLVEDRHDDNLVGVVDPAVEGVVRHPDVAVLDAGVLAVVLQDVLDDDRLDDRVQVSTRSGVHQVALRREDRDHHVAGDAHAAPGRPLEDLQRLVEDVVGALEAYLVVALLERLDGPQFVFGSFGQLDRGQLLFGRRYRHFLPPLFLRLENTDRVLVHPELFCGRHHDRGVLGLEESRSRHHVTRLQRVEVVHVGFDLAVRRLRPIRLAAALASRRRVLTLQLVLLELQLLPRYCYPQHERVYVDAAGEVDGQRRKCLAELLLELLVEAPDVLFAVNKEVWSGGPLRVDLAAVEHVQLQAEDCLVQRQTLGLQLLLGPLHHLVDDVVEGLVVRRRLLGYRLDEGHALGALVKVHDVHH